MTFDPGPACACSHPVEQHDDLGCTVIGADGVVCDCLVDFEQA